MRSVVGRLLVAAVAERSRGASLVFQVGDIILHVFRHFRHYSGGKTEVSEEVCLMADKQRMHLSCRKKIGDVSGNWGLLLFVLTFEEQGR